MHHVILGAGPAGVTAAETLRAADPDSTITLIGGEAGAPYARMAIPYYLTGQIGEDGTHLRKAVNHLDAHAINYRAGRAGRLDTADKIVTLEDGDTLTYDTLLIATGSHPVTPPVPGLDLPGVHHCWTLDDARAIKARARSGANVVLMGAGFIGCIVLESLVAMDCAVTVLEAQDRMVPRMMDATAGGMLKRWVEAKGVTVKTDTRVSGVAEKDGALAVALDDGTSVSADLVIVATGVAANVDFLDGSGIDVDEGILVNDRLATDADGVFAAGDVAQGPDFFGGFSVHAIQPTATEHGRIAALNMAGQDARYQGSLPMNVLDTAGLISFSFGDWNGDTADDTASTQNADAFQYLRLNFSGETLIGALGVGRSDAIGTLRGLIQSKIPLGPWKDILKANPHRLQDAYVACTQGT